MLARRASLVAIALAIVAAMALCAGLAGCGGDTTLKDGTYTGTSSVMEDYDGIGSGYGVVTITIRDGAITACTFVTYEKDGTLKDANYGKTLNDNQAFYAMAQKAVAACDEYAAALVAAGSLDGVDAISGATVNYDQFCEAVDDALAQARG